MIEHRLLNRGKFAGLCNALGIKDAVEIGTHQAVFANEFMSKFDGTIVLVDPWANQSALECGKFYPQFSDSTENRDEDMAVAISAMSEYGDRCDFLRMTSHEAAAHFTDASVGFVYIDGLHDYESVKNDIADWWPKVSPGGILAGHDYQADCLPAVVIAVDEFVQKNGFALNTTTEPGASWWIRKQETTKGYP